MKHLFIGSLLLTVTLLSSCGNKLKDEIEKLQKQNEILTAESKKVNDQNELLIRVVKKLIERPKQGLKGVNGKDKIDLIPIPKDEITKGVTTLSKDRAIKIPSAWIFESAQILDMLTHFNDAGVMANGIYAYPIEDSDGKLSIALVPYIDSTGNTRVLIDNADPDQFKAYDYSHMCPTYCPKYNLFGTSETEFLVFD